MPRQPPHWGQEGAGGLAFEADALASPERLARLRREQEQAVAAAADRWDEALLRQAVVLAARGLLQLGPYEVWRRAGGDSAGQDSGNSSSSGGSACGERSYADAVRGDSGAGPLPMEAASSHDPHNAECPYDAEQGPPFCLCSLAARLPTRRGHARRGGRDDDAESGGSSSSSEDLSGGSSRAQERRRLRRRRLRRLRRRRSEGQQHSREPHSEGYSTPASLLSNDSPSTDSDSSSSCSDDLRCSESLPSDSDDGFHRLAHSPRMRRSRRCLPGCFCDHCDPRPSGWYA